MHATQKFRLQVGYVVIRCQPVFCQSKDELVIWHGGKLRIRCNIRRLIRHTVVTLDRNGD